MNCSATVCHHVAETFPRDELAAYPNVDGIVALTHGTGCGMADRGEGFATLQRTLWGYARHPNFAGVLMIGLGCEVNQIDFLLEAYQIQRGPHFRTMTMQGTRRHPQDHRARAGDDPRDAAARQRGAAPDDLGLRDRRSPCNAAARMPIPA